MEKNCRTCKWYENERCTNYRGSLQIEESGSKSIEFVESGMFADAVREKVDFEKIIGAVLDELIENEIIKKSYIKDLSKLNKLINKDNIIETIEEELNDELANSVMNMDDKVEDVSFIEIANPYDFYCSEWE